MMCNTAPAQEVSDRDATLLKTAKENQVKKISKMKRKKKKTNVVKKCVHPERYPY